jgi:hypothetical protein
MTDGRATRLGGYLLDRAAVIALLILGVYLVLALLSASVLVINRRTQIQLEEVERVIAANQQTLDFLEACLVPGQPCSESLTIQFEVQRKRTTGALGCMLVLPESLRTPEALRKCVDEAVAANPLPRPEDVPGLEPESSGK